MNSRQRVIAAINHRRHDRVPVDIGSTYATGMTVAAYGKVRAALGLAGGAIRVVDPIQMLAEVELPVIEALGGDAVGLYLGGGPLHSWQDWAMPDGTDVLMPGNIELARRPDGGWQQLRNGVAAAIMPAGGWYFDPVEYPQWPTIDPDALTDELLADIRTRAHRCRDDTDLAVVLNTPWAISNSTSADFMCDLMLAKDKSHDQLDRWSDSIVQCLAKLLETANGCVDVMCFSGDAGAQNAPLFGPDLYREMIVPHMRKIPAYLHANSDVKFFLHSCGSVHDLIDSFIDMGVDILNPLQLSAANMEPDRLVREFGGRIAFWGGGCDTQHVLPHGTTDDVRRHVADTMGAYAAVPGFVFSQVHNIQPDVSAENIMAMIDEVNRRE